MEVYTTLEIERPEGWSGEAVYSESAELISHEVDVIGLGEYWSDNNYGADRDGNRGEFAHGVDLDEIRFFLNGEKLHEKAFSNSEVSQAVEKIEELIISKNTNVYR